MFDDISLLQVLTAIGVLALFHIVQRLTVIIRQLETSHAQLRTLLEVKTKHSQVVEAYLAAARWCADTMEEMEAVATYRRLADDCVKSQFRDPDRENDGIPWDADDEREHALRMAEQRYRKHHFEGMASSARRGYLVPESPNDSLEQLQKPTARQLKDDFPRPLTPERVALRNRTRKAIKQSGTKT